MFVLFLSPPEIPRVICVPTWRKEGGRDQSVGLDSLLMS